MLTYDDIVQEIPHLTLQERVQLLRVIADTLEKDDVSPARKHHILEFEGIAARLADDEDPRDHVRRLRAEWDERP
jgi:hypothetical protein